jgi:two-component system, cell cycle response regulator DivK
MATETILIIDDSPMNLKLLHLLLAGEGFDVRTSPSAEEALNLLRDFRPRLILSDVQLPGISGLELARRLKADPQMRGIRLVAVTALAMKGDKETALNAGFDGYVAKPIDTRTFPSLVQAYLAAGTAPPEPVIATEQAAAADQSVPDIPGFAGLRQRFVEEGVVQCRALLEAMEGPFDAAEARNVMHQWVGAAGLIGLGRISQVSREAEELLRERPVDGAEVRETLLCLRDEFSRAQSPAPYRSNLLTMPLRDRSCPGRAASRSPLTRRLETLPRLPQPA